MLDQYKPHLSVEDIEEILGIEKFDEEIAEKSRFVYLQCCGAPYLTGYVLTRILVVPE